MSPFDIIAGLLLLISGAVGFVRGATREVVTVLAFLAAAIAGVWALRFSGPIARGAIDPDWLGNIAAIVIVFVIVYILLRLVGGLLTRRVQDAAALGTLDRIVGLAFGLVRALVILGVFALAFNAATPADRVPEWISTARLYPLSQAAGAVLRTFAPHGAQVARDVTPTLERAVRDGEAPKSSPP